MISQRPVLFFRHEINKYSSPRALWRMSLTVLRKPLVQIMYYIIIIDWFVCGNNTAVFAKHDIVLSKKKKNSSNTKAHPIPSLLFKRRLTLKA